MKAHHTRPSGFSDRQFEPDLVTILGFVFGEYAPGYWSDGNKKCVLAVIAGEDGHLSVAELPHLKLTEPRS